MERVTVIDELGVSYSLDIPQDLYMVLSALHASPYSSIELLLANQELQRAVDALSSPSDPSAE